MSHIGMIDEEVIQFLLSDEKKNLKNNYFFKSVLCYKKISKYVKFVEQC